MDAGTVTRESRRPFWLWLSSEINRKKKSTIDRLLAGTEINDLASYAYWRGYHAALKEVQDTVGREVQKFEKSLDK